MRGRKLTHFQIFALLLALILVLGACSSEATVDGEPTAAVSEETVEEEPTAVVRSEETAVEEPAAETDTGAGEAETAVGEVASINVSSQDDLTFLTDSAGMSLYLFLADTQGAESSTCYDACAEAWPPLLTEAAPEAGDPAVDTSLLGTFEREDGTMQVTYNGWPLYYFVRDEAPGDINGQGVSAEWYLVSPEGNEAVAEAEEAEAMPTETPEAEAESEGTGALVGTRDKDGLGTYLVDAEGMSLYLFLADTQGEAMSTCYDACAEAWPPLLTEAPPEAADQADISLLGTFERDDGSLQVTYNGWPLYYFVRDEAPGDTNGQGVDGFGAGWYVLTPAGDQLEAEAASEDEMEQEPTPEEEIEY